MPTTAMRQRVGFAAIALLALSVVTTSAAQDASTIRGRVVDEQGRPVVSATVTVDGGPLAAATGDDGGFLLEGVTLEIVFQLHADSIPLKEIVVTARASLLREEPASILAMDRGQISELPHFGDDFYRAITVLPGVSGGDISARFAVRGGLYDETLVILDDQELMEPFHLKDFQGVFSILDPEMIGGVELTPGGFTAEHGDRMTGVLDMVTRSPEALRFGAGVSLTTAWVNARGRFADNRGSWLASARRGYLDYILDATGSDDDDDDPPDPRYWDAFGKATYSPNPSHSLSMSLLYADDSILWREDDEDELADVTTGYSSTYLWTGHQAVVGPSSFVNTGLYLGEISVDRSFLVIDEPDEQYSLDDVRDDRFFGLRQGWEHGIGSRHYLRWGFDLRSYDAKYDYELDAVIDDPIDDPRFYPGERLSSFHGSFEGEQYSVYVSDRVRLGRRVIGEAGVRYDRQALADEDHLSPRLNLLCNVSDNGIVRLGWGHFYQSQRPYELRVEFGETEFLPAQRAEQYVVGYETEIGGELALKIDAYLREVEDPHPRWETIFDPWSPVPETAVDVAEIAPESVTAYGVEVYLAGRSGGSFDWWVSYAYSSIEDRIDGEDTPRFLNQPHSLTASATWRPGPKWSLTGVFNYHTGWAGTAVTASAVETPSGYLEISYDVGPFYQERLGDYYRLDLRASRTSRLGKRGELTFFIDVQNLSNRNNQRGIAIDDPDYHLTPEGGWVATFSDVHWLPIIPSFGVSFEF